MTEMRRQHLTSIDALRGFAALSVVLFHLGGAGLPKLASPLTISLTSWGWTGVEIFFVISGFVIPFVMLKSSYQWRHGGSFLTRRFIRIWPPSAILVALTVAQFAVVNYIQGGASDVWSSPSAGKIFANLFYAVPFTDHSWLNGVLWTLAVEFEYYLFLALAFPLIASSRAWLVSTGLASLITAILPGAETVLFLKYAAFFAMGGLCLLFHEQHIRRAFFLAVLGLMAGVASVQLGMLATGFATATALIIAFVPIQNRLFVFLGTISYSLYLIHMLVASTTEFLLAKAFEPVNPSSRLVAQIVCIAVAIGGAWVFYQLVERHFVTLSQQFSRRVRDEKKKRVSSVIADEGL